MDWLTSMNAALDYIEDHLNIRMDYSKVAAKAGCSSYNFQRMFSFIADVTLATYVRRRCMTVAAQELMKGDVSVIDVAFRYGYDSPISFARAFQSVQGMTPKEAMKEGANLKLYPKISFQISIKGAESMKYRIEKMDAFRLAGVSKEITTVNNQNFEIIPKMWDDFMKNGECEKIAGVNGHPMEEEMYGVCYDFHFDQEQFRYMIAAKPDNEISEGLEGLDIPEFTWVKFECMGAAGIQDVFKRMFTEWFPTSGYEHADGPEIEYYPIENMNHPDYKCEVWIPIQPITKK
ncbi:transcriptional regulator, AraC family [Lachnospiraceae bacterium KM106-2]|nr:transcriptional regulator, AraC family [Lachnospiraceae bacterium KM106-2]